MFSGTDSPRLYTCLKTMAPISLFFYRFGYCNTPYTQYDVVGAGWNSVHAHAHTQGALQTCSA